VAIFRNPLKPYEAREKRKSKPGTKMSNASSCPARSETHTPPPPPPNKT